MPVRSACLLVLFGSLGGIGCHPRPTTSPSDGAGEATANAPQDEGSPEGDREACTRYVAHLCEAAGEGSAPCAGKDELILLLPSAACVAGERDFAYTTQRATALRATCTDVVGRLCAAIGPETDTCLMVRQQTEEFPAARCQDLANDYDAVLAEVQAIESRKQPLSAELAKAISAEDAPAFGPKDAKVTVVEFSDFECPYCAKAAEVVEQLRESHGDQVRFVFRQFPLSFHEHARDAAQAALAAHAQGKFWEYHDLLFAHQSALSTQDLRGYAKEAGLKLAKFDQALRDNAYAAAIERDLELGAQVAVQGTPTIFVNGVRVENATDYDAVVDAIKTATAGGSSSPSTSPE